jgi:hypothetical protein
LKINGNPSLSVTNTLTGDVETTTAPILLITAREISSAHLSLVIVLRNLGYLRPIWKKIAGNLFHQTAGNSIQSKTKLMKDFNNNLH